MVPPRSAARRPPRAARRRRRQRRRARGVRRRRRRAGARRVRRGGRSWPAAWRPCRSRWTAGCWSCTAGRQSVIPRLAAAIGAAAVHASADYGPYGRRRDERVAKALRDKGIELGDDRVAVRGGARPGAQARRHRLRGLHALLPRLVRRTAGARRPDPVAASAGSTRLTSRP